MIKLKNILSEAKMVLRRKGGKEVTFTNKDNYEKAKKSGDYVSPDKKKYTKQDVDSDMYAQDTWKRFGGDTGTDADFQGEPPEGAREPEGEPETDLDINNFEDAKKVQVKIEDSHSQANRLEDDFYKSEEYKELKKGMSREEEIELFDEIREKIRAVERQLSGAMHDDPNAGDYKDDKELQQRITTYKAKEVDALEDDAKLFVRDPEAFKKELYKKKEGGEEPSGEPKTFDDIKNHHSKAESAQDKVKDMIDKHNADHQMQDDDYEKWEDKSEALKAIENELQALTADDPNDSSYDGYKKGQKELTKQYISTLNKLSPAAKKILNKEEDKPSGEPEGGDKLPKQVDSSQDASQLQDKLDSIQDKYSEIGSKWDEKLDKLSSIPRDKITDEQRKEMDEAEKQLEKYSKASNIAKEMMGIDVNSEEGTEEFNRLLSTLNKQMDDNPEESIKIINGKKYRAIKESVEPTIDLCEIGALHERMKVNWDKK